MPAVQETIERVRRIETHHAVGAVDVEIAEEGSDGETGILGITNIAAVVVAEAAAATNALCLFHGRTASLVGRDLDPEGWASSSRVSDVPYAPLVAVRKRHAHWRGASFGLARRGSD